MDNPLLGGIVKPDNPLVSPTIPPFRRDFDAARDAYTARNALGIDVAALIALTTGKIKTVTQQTFTGSGTYTPTSGMAFCIIECLGAGGGGGGTGGDGINYFGAGGGGS